MSDKGSKPHLTINGYNGIQLAVWKNLSQRGKEYRSIKITRSFKRDENSEWENTDYFNPWDLMNIAEVCIRAAHELARKNGGPGLDAPANPPPSGVAPSTEPDPEDVPY